MTAKLNKQKKFLLNVLSCSILFSMQNGYAMQAMNDRDMRAVDGQDGIIADVSYGSVGFDQLYWDDKTGSSATANTQDSLRASLTGVKITTANANQSNVTVKMNAGSLANGSKTGLDLDVAANLGTVQADKFTLCKTSDSISTCTNAASFGKLSIQNTANTPITMHMTTADGLFSKTGFSSLDLGIKGLDIGLSQKQDSSTYNALVMNDFNFNFGAKGYMYVDPTEGLVLRTNPVAGSGATDIGYVDFKRDVNGKSGLNLEFMLQPNVASNGTMISANSAKGVIRAGANGRMINGVLQLRGTQDTASTILGVTNGNSIAGDTGLAFRLNGEFTSDRDNLSGVEATSLELGGAGNQTYGLRFANITPLLTRKNIIGTETTSGVALNSDHAGLSMDGIYFNLVNANQITLPTNTALTSTYLGNSVDANKLVNTNDYIQTLSTNNTPYTVLAIRGMNFSALSRRGQFIYTDANGVVSPVSTTTKWGLGLPIYNLNANFAFSPRLSNGSASGDYLVAYNNGVIQKTAISGSERIGFSGSISTQGVSSDGSKSTSIILIDGGANANDNNNPTDYYVGLRNIDMLLNGTGSMGFENGRINVSMPKLLMAMSAQLAAGYLPGAKYKTCPSSSGCYASSDSFTKNYDVLAAIKLRLAGQANFSIIPLSLTASDYNSDGTPKEDKNALNFIGLLELDKTQNNSIQLVDPIDGSTMGLDNIVGTVAFDNKIVVNSNNVGFNLGFNFNPNKTAAEVFRVKNIDFYPSVNGTVGSAQRLGELAITGGRLTSEMKITPRDGVF
ncbi:hypothetical protein N5J48_07780 [Acinetobacter ursingii]|uniref:Heme utilization protein n=3 Tax=Acinetobacter ursingii TaxID=108980 RepID=A0AA46PEB9_9GAMM|nr:hypothetical protein [Acinetobacter ursingii]MCU4490127.1 hypothetical protein [Acinetobacter ursingii]MCU4496625.1 hypothetical protein [Acinetobacter ursingii]MCU4589011.1 hypothetical protein [Acinetobacter ursingii]MDA3579816.1 hypothetical protein [Acinetobacter ursingii]MDG9860245.1 hypothetical protein [Acinetobacter ursingii]